MEYVVHMDIESTYMEGVLTTDVETRSNQIGIKNRPINSGNFLGKIRNYNQAEEEKRQLHNAMATVSKLNRGTYSKIIANSPYYRLPDTEMHVFKNTARNIYYNVDNIVRPVRHMSIISPKLQFDIAKEKPGVFIIKYYNFYKDSLDLMDIKDIVKVFGSASTELDYKHYNILNVELEEFMLDTGRDMLKVRFYIFIPEEDIRYHGVLKSNFLKGSLLIGNPNRLSNAIKRNEDTVINISISDNKQDVYYLALGGRVYTIPSNNNRSGRLEGNLKIETDCGVIVDTTLQEENISEYGIFHSISDAKRSIDISTHLEMEKIAYEREKLYNNRYSNNMKHATEVIKHKTNLQNIAGGMVENNMKMEISKIKYAEELLKTASPLRTAMIKLSSDIISKIINITIF